MASYERARGTALILSALVAAVVAASGPWAREVPSVEAGAALRCTLQPGPALAVVRVERDTVLPFAPVDAMVNSFSTGVGERDSLLAVAGTQMPAARVRLVRLDSATRAALTAQGVGEREPVAFLRAAPYRADCRTVRWTDTVPFARPGEAGFLRATLAPREQWVNGAPVLVVQDVWRYPYPRRRALAPGAPADAVLAAPEAVFDLETALDALRLAPSPRGEMVPREAWDSVRAAQRARAVAWARANPAEAEREPTRATVRRAVLDPDWDEAARSPSRLRGTYRVTMTAGDARGVWYFRTHARPSNPWRGRDTLQSTAALLALPHIAGYQLVGYAGSSPDSLADALQRWRRAVQGGERRPLVWLAAEDRPTLPGNDGRHALDGVLEFNLGAAPGSLWSALEAFVPPMSARDSVFFARAGRVPPRAERQPRLPITLRLDARGGVRVDTSFAFTGGRVLRVQLERLDTRSVPRPW